MCNTLQDIKDGNLDSFRAAYQEYHVKLYYYAFKHTQSEYLAEETVQLSFIKLWEKRASLSNHFDLSVQLFRIAKSIMIDLIRKQKVQQTHQHAFAETVAQYIETDLTPKYTLHKVYDHIEKLSPLRKLVFKLNRFEGLSHKEIAEKLSISPKAVENQILRAVRQLKDALMLAFILWLQSRR
ncbi:RNA polymerase sigma-70 factor, ECF subfamily [Filimonas lacunae]|uniref:RNA polymerase sigma-70 factor, ECF subfamily n=1 Tax=Filimonas lacunae TaxID=477680 RepID=A0A173MH92_9BACT|nr:sigma-70 family RNA polymerase sigma factor [Filimonas lacunae]BAV06847.1 RNA polymerase ECF-type sigma factor [Filimonas lacunae]SIS98909.1 RNA polymerase sigma-70 factor, ECF subfamily [Filimonas lacunae]